MAQEHLRLRDTVIAPELPIKSEEPREVSRAWKSLWLVLGWGLALYQTLIATITLRDMYANTYNGEQHLTFIIGFGFALILLLGMYTWLKRVDKDQ